MSLKFSTSCPHLALCMWISSVLFSSVTLGCHCDVVFNEKINFLLLNFPYVVHTRRCAGGFLLCFFLALH